MQTLWQRCSVTQVVLCVCVVSVCVCVCVAQVLVLAAVMGRSFSDYYFSPLVTLWSLFFYSLHTVGSRYSLRARLLFAAFLCCLLRYHFAAS